MIKKNSIYSLNKKNPDAIVYPSATGKPVFVTREDFPSEEEFLAFKKWSDENFHSEEKLDHRESNRTVSADNISDAAFATPAIDVEMERQQKQDDRRKMASDMVVKLKDKLTETQFRRFLKTEYSLTRYVPVYHELCQAECHDPHSEASDQSACGIRIAAEPAMTDTGLMILL